MSLFGRLGIRIAAQAGGLFCGVIFVAATATAQAPAPTKYPVTEGDYIAHDFKFKSGETLAELRLHWTEERDVRSDPHQRADARAWHAHPGGRVEVLSESTTRTIGALKREASGRCDEGAAS